MSKFVFEMDVKSYIDIAIGGNYIKNKCRFEEFKILNAKGEDTSVSLCIIFGKEFFSTKPNKILDSKMFINEYETFTTENKINFSVNYFVNHSDNTIVNWQTSGPMLLMVYRGENDKYNSDLRLQVTGYYNGYVDRNGWSLDAFKNSLLNNSSIHPVIRKFEFVS